MDYTVLVTPRAIKDLDALPREDAQRVLRRIQAMRHGLAGDVKRLTNFRPAYWMRAGDCRVLFDIEGTQI